MSRTSHTRLATFVEQVIAQSPAISRIENDVDGLKAEQQRQGGVQETMLADIAVLKAEQQRQGGVQETMLADIAVLKTESRRHGVLQEAVQSDVRLILDAVLAISRLKPRVDQHDEEIAGLRGDVHVTQAAVRKHMKDKRLHRE